MLFDGQLASFALFAGVVTITPGTDTLLVVRNGLKGSARDGIVTTFGICSGLFLHALLSAVGVSAILLHSAKLFGLMKALGAAYIFWVGLKSILNAVKGNGFAALEEGTAPSPERTTAGFFTEGFLTNVLNPKVAIFYLAFLPQFIGPDDPVVAKSLLMALIHYVMGIVWLVFISIGVGRARGYITRPSTGRKIEAGCGAMLVGLGLKLGLEKG